MAELQSTNRVKIGRAREATFGTTPASPVFRTMRQTSSSLSSSPQTVVSNEIRADRQVTDLILTGFEAGGDVAGEMSFRNMDDLFEEALQGAWSLKAVRDNDGTSDSVITAVTASSDSYTVTDAAVDFVEGHLVLASGFTAAANNSLFRAQTGTSGTSVVAPSSPGLADESAPPGAAVLRAVGFQGASGDLVATTTGGNALTSTTLDFTTLGLAPGEWVLIGGSASGVKFATAAANGWARISAVAAHRLSFGVVPSGFTDDAGTSKTIEVFFGDFLVNGTTKRSNTFERQYLDHSPVSYEYLRGLTLDRLSIDIQSAQVATWTASYIGADAEVTASRASGASDVAAAATDVINAAADVGRLGFGGAAVGTPNYVMSATIEANNNLRRQLAVGHRGAVGIGNGEFTVTGTLNFYFGDRTVADAVMQNSLVSFDVRLGGTDANRESYVIDLPAVKLSSGAPTVSGKNQDVMIEAGYQAIMDATLGYTASVGRFWYLPA